MDGYSESHMCVGSETVSRGILLFGPLRTDLDVVAGGFYAADLATSVGTGS